MRQTGRRDPGRELLDVVGAVRRRWRTRQLLQGGAIVLAAGFLVFFASTWGIDRLRFEDTAVTAFRIVLWGTLAGLVAWFLIRPLVRRVSDQQVALYLEEHEPSLKSAFLSAVETARGGYAAHGGLEHRLLETAMERARRVERGQRVERDRLRRSSAWLGGVGSAVALTVLFGPAFQGTAGSLLLGPWKTADAANPYSITVEPGDVLIARGSDQRVTAYPQGFETADVEIAVRRGDSEVWDRYAMTPDEAGTAFDILLFDLDEPADYTVESEGVRSEVFRIDVADLPYVDRIDLEYRFPAYTGLSPRIVEDGGDIAAIRGTEVRLQVTPTLPTSGARIVFDDDPEGGTPLEIVGEGFEVSIQVDRETFYRIELEGPNGRYVTASPDFLVEPLDDQPPVVTVVEPGRDRNASPIEEVYIEVEAEDDFGVGALELVYSINGAAEETITLHRTTAGGSTDVSRGHTLFLEEYGLEPGDVVSYYARATDLGAGAGTRQETSDIYFLEIRPFDRDFRQAEQGGGGGGGGGADGMNGELSEQQRQIVAATFRLVRDEDEFDAAELSENLATLTLLQGRLREQVEELVAQMQSRGIGADPTFRAVLEELPQAAEAMREAELQLGERALDDALSPEQRALQHLQRAEAAFRDVQVQMGRQGGGGGNTPGNQGANAEELADLFELEMDKLRNQYESVQRGDQQQRDQKVDEALQKLEELARRQQQMNERAAAQPRGAAAGGSGQQQLIQETEELARQLERLSREDDRPELRESARRLQEAADRMRESAANGRQGQGQAEAQTALERLREARRLLENRQTAAIERQVSDALQRAERMVERQRDLADDVARESEGGNSDRLTELRDRKDELAAEVDALENDLNRMSRESRREQPDASRTLAEAAETIRESRLRDKILFSKGVLGTRSEDYTRNFEEQITADTEAVRDQIASAAEAFRETDPRRLGQQLEEARDLVRGLQSLQERMDQRAREGQQGQGEQGQGQGEQGQGEGGEGQGQGEQGQGQGEGRQQGEGQGQGQQGEGQQGQGQGQQGGIAGGANASGGGFGPGAAGSSGGLTPEDIRQFQREFGQRRADAEALRDDLRREGVDVGELPDVISALDRLANLQSFDDPEEIARLQDAVIRGLKDFEFGLRRGLTAEIERLFLSGSDDVPPAYRRLVEEYYRALSEGRPPR